LILACVDFVATQSYTLSLHDALPILIVLLMSDTLFFDTFGKGQKEAKVLKNTKDCVIYTRVSSQQQADNLSLATQLKACTLYAEDRKSTRLNSSHVKISYAVFCLKKK